MSHYSRMKKKRRRHPQLYAQEAARIRAEKGRVINEKQKVQPKTEGGL